MPILLYIFIFICAISNVIESEVIGVQDGDTITLRAVYNGTKAYKRQGKNLRIRLTHVDCPEKKQVFYQQAKQFTSDLCFRKKVKIIHNNEFDRYGRLLAEVVLPNGKILNQELVKAGLAIHFKKYSKSILYANLEIEAKIQKRGIWM